MQTLNKHYKNNKDFGITDNRNVMKRKGRINANYTMTENTFPTEENS